MHVPEALGIDATALERFINEQIYTLPGTCSHRDAFTVLITGSRAAKIHTHTSDVDIDILCTPPVYESVRRASFEAGTIKSERGFWFVLRDDKWDRYFGKEMGHPHFSLTSLAKVEEHFRNYEDVPLWIWLNAEVIADPKEQFRRIRNSWHGYPPDVLVRKIKYHWLLAGYYEVDAYPHHHSQDDQLLSASVAILDAVNELLRFFFLVEGRPFPYTEKLVQMARKTKLGAEFIPMLQHVVDLAVGKAGGGLAVWERLDKAFETLCCYDRSEECRRLDDACAEAMIAAGVDPQWVKADYDNVEELLMGELGPIPQ